MKEDETLTYYDFVPALLVEVPEFQPFYDEHMRDQHGELLPHGLMSDFTRFLFEAYRNSVSEGEDRNKWHSVVTKSLDIMEYAIQAQDVMLQNLISVSFVENLLPSSEDDIGTFKAIRLLLGPKLQEEMRYYVDFFGLTHFS